MKEQEKPYSAGVIIRKDSQILIVHGTNNKYWNLPKGMPNAGESFEETAARETKEETGIIIPINELKLIGRFKYLTKKDLVLFEYQPKELPNTSSMKCTSLFTYKKKEIPEVDDYKYCEISKIDNILNPSLVGVLQTIYSNI